LDNRIDNPRIIKYNGDKSKLLEISDLLFKLGGSRMRSLASIQIISDIKTIEGADAIELVLIKGWQCVAKKGDFMKGDMSQGLALPISDFLDFIKMVERDYTYYSQLLGNEDKLTQDLLHKLELERRI